MTLSIVKVDCPFRNENYKKSYIFIYNSKNAYETFITINENKLGP